MKDIIMEYIPAPPPKHTKPLSDAAVLTMFNNGKFDPDADLVQEQHKEHEDGHVRAVIQTNINGYALFDPYWGGRYISENFKTRELAEEYAVEWVAEDPGRHHFFMERK